MAQIGISASQPASPIGTPAAAKPAKRARLRAWWSPLFSGGAPTDLITPIHALHCGAWQYGYTRPKDNAGSWNDHADKFPAGRRGMLLDHLCQPLLDSIWTEPGYPQHLEPFRASFETVFRSFATGRVPYTDPIWSIDGNLPSVLDSLRGAVVGMKSLPDLIECNVEKWPTIDGLGARGAEMCRLVLKDQTCRSWMPPAVQALDPEVVIDWMPHGSEGRRQRGLWACYCYELVNRSVYDLVVASGLYAPGRGQVLVQTACVRPRFPIYDGNGWEQLQRWCNDGACNWQLYFPWVSGPARPPLRDAPKADDPRWTALINHINFARACSDNRRGTYMVPHLSVDFSTGMTYTTPWLYRQQVGHLCRIAQPGNVGPDGVENRDLILFNEITGARGRQHEAIADQVIREHAAAIADGQAADPAPIPADADRIDSARFSTTYAQFVAAMSRPVTLSPTTPA